MVRTVCQENFDTSPPSQQTIYRLRNRFDEASSVSNALKSARTKTSESKENEMLMAMTFPNSPSESTQRASAELSIPRLSLHRSMRKLKLKPYRPRLVHGL